MVASLTLGKKKYAAVEGEILQLQTRSAELQAKLLDMVERDAQVFEPLAKAYGLPVQTGEERAEKSRVMEQALAAASAVPMEIMGLCMQALPLIERYAQIGSRLAVSDAGCAAACCQAALAAAGLNVLINTKSMENRSLADSLNDRVNTMLQEGTALATAIYAAVRTQLI
jgi:formiminotetrahydrofolate cyclodeaminase